MHFTFYFPLHFNICSLLNTLSFLFPFYFIAFYCPCNFLHCFFTICLRHMTVFTHLAYLWPSAGQNDAHLFASLNIILVMLFNTLSTLHTNRSLSEHPHTCDPPLSLSYSLVSLSEEVKRFSTQTWCKQTAWKKKKKETTTRVSEGFGPITQGFPLPSANQGLDAFLHIQSETTPLKNTSQWT